MQLVEGATHMQLVADGNIKDIIQML